VVAEVGPGHGVLVGSSEDLCRGRGVGSNGSEGYEGRVRKFTLPKFSS